MKFPLGMQSKHFPVLSVPLSATSVSLAISWPSPVLAGDVALLFDQAGSTTLPSEVVPTGFTKILGVAYTNARQTVSYKLCTGSESGTITGQNGGGMGKVLLIVRGTPVIKNVAVMPSPNNQGLQGTPARQTVPASGKPPSIIVVAGAGSTLAAVPAFDTPSPAFTAQVSAASRISVGYNLDNMSPVDHAMGFVGNGTSNYNFLTSFYLSLS